MRSVTRSRWRWRRNGEIRSHLRPLCDRLAEQLVQEVPGDTTESNAAVHVYNAANCNKLTSGQTQQSRSTDWLTDIMCKVQVKHNCWHNRGIQKWAVPGYAHALFSEIFHGLLFGWTLCMMWPNSIFLYAPVIWGTDKATNFQFCTHIYRLNRSKSPLKISERVAVNIVRDSRKFSGHPYVGRIARSSLR